MFRWSTNPSRICIWQYIRPMVMCMYLPLKDTQRNAYAFMYSKNGFGSLKRERNYSPLISNQRESIFQVKPIFSKDNYIDCVLFLRTLVQCTQKYQETTSFFMITAQAGLCGSHHALRYCPYAIALTFLVRSSQPAPAFWIKNRITDFETGSIV